MNPIRSIVSAILLVAALAAQYPSLVTTFAGGNSGGNEWTAYFDLRPARALNIVQFDLNLSSPVGTPGTIDVYVTAPGGTHVGNEVNASAWTLVSSSLPFTSAGPGNPTLATLPGPVLLTVASFGVAIRCRGVAMADTNGTGSNQSYSNSELALTAGSVTESVSAPFTGTLHRPRVWNGALYYYQRLRYAQATTYGSGCGGGGPSTMYELFDGVGSVVDLSNTGFSMGWHSNDPGYTVRQGAGPIVAPSSVPLRIWTFGMVTVSLPWAMPSQIGNVRQISVCSQGYVHFGVSTLVSDRESVQTMLGYPCGVYGLWDALDPAAGGSIHAESDPTDPTRFHVTWLGVFERNTSNPNTFQITFSQSGDIEVKYGTLTCRDALVGYSRGSFAINPAAVDISALGTHLIGDGRWTLGLSASGTPVLGRNILMITEGYPANTLGGVLAFGVQQASVALDPIGMVGCRQYVIPDVTLPFQTTGFHANHLLSIPLTPSLAGTSLYLQSFAVTPGANALGVVSTDGVHWLLDVL